MIALTVRWYRQYRLRDADVTERLAEQLRPFGTTNTCVNLGTVNAPAATLGLLGRAVLPAFADSP